MNHNDITLTYELPNGERVNTSPQPTLAIDNQQAKLVDVHIDTNARLILDTDYIIEELTADIELAEDFLADFDLNHYYSEVFVQDTELHIVIGAPNNTTIPVVIDLAKLSNGLRNKDVYRAIIKAIGEFDPYDTFDEFYCATNCPLSPSEFLEKLQKDGEFFADVAKDMEKKFRGLTISSAWADYRRARV